MIFFELTIKTQKAWNTFIKKGENFSRSRNDKFFCSESRCEAHVALFNSNYFVYVVVEYNFLFYLKFNIIIQIILMFGAMR